MKDETKKRIIEWLEVIFISGDTYMIVAWVLFLIGLILGGLLF